VVAHPRVLGDDVVDGVPGPVPPWYVLPRADLGLGHTGGERQQHARDQGEHDEQPADRERASHAVPFGRSRRSHGGEGAEMGRALPTMLTRRAPMHPPIMTNGFVWEYLDVGGTAVGRSTPFSERD